MDDIKYEQIEALKTEYKAIYQLWHEHVFSGFKVVPTLLTLSIAVIGIVSSENPYAGIAVSYILPMILIYHGINQTSARNAALRIVEIEKEVNEMLGSVGAAGMSFWTENAANQASKISCFRSQMILVFIFQVFLFIFACVQAYMDIERLSVGRWKWIILCIPIMAFFLALYYLIKLEIDAVREKKKILKKYEGSMDDTSKS